MKHLKRLFKTIGPGFITGAADDDPSGIATYSQTGAMFGLGQLWTTLFNFPFMVIVQEMCGRIGLVTGKGLAQVLKENYSKKVLYFAVLLLLIANAVNIGADLGAMASVLVSLLKLPFALVLFLVTILTLVLEIFVPYPTYAKYLKYLTVSLLSYVFVAFIVVSDWGEVFSALVTPNFSFSSNYVMMLAAILGTTISPYLFFWQADEEVEEEIAHHKLRAMGKSIPKIGNMDIRQMRLDTLIGMFFSQIVTFFIISSVAMTLHKAGIYQINTADEAALALKPLAGNFAFLLFSLGILGTGLLAVPVLAGSASYAIGEAFNMRVGLWRKFSRAHGFYGVMTLATIAGLVVNFLNVSPFMMLYYSAVLNGVIAPPLLFLIVMIGNDRRIMGEHTNSRWAGFLGLMIATLMGVVAVSVIYQLFI
jgi:NRAMP (natural resistance-associated macrophage protein)-like metal ion transporter